MTSWSIIITFLFSYFEPRAEGVVSGSPVITLTPIYNPLIVKIGDSITLSATAGINIDSFTWYRNGTSLKTETNATRSTYTIAKATLSSNGIYRCTGQSGNTTGSATKNITVQYGPTNMVVSNSRPVVNEDTNISITCSAHSNPTSTIHWEKEGSAVFRQNSTTLTITSAARNDSGTYVCVAKNIVNPSIGSIQTLSSNKSITLDILYKPEVMIKPIYNPYHVFKGQDVTLVCDVISNPVSTINWTKGSSSRVLSSSSSYRILNVQKTDDGFYKCTAGNSVGNGSDTVNIKVNYAPEIKPMSVQKPVEGTNVLMSCEASSYPATSNIWWERNRDKTFKKIGRVLSIQNISRDMNDSYTCFAMNTFTLSEKPRQNQTRSSTVIIDVLYGPENSLVVNTKNAARKLTLTAGQSADSVLCSATCNPECSFTWTKPNSTSLPNPLNFEEVTKTSAGIYTCFANNSVLNSGQNLSLEVNVLYSPSITSFDVTNGSSKTEGEPAIITCNVDSNPSSDITIKSETNDTFIKSVHSRQSYTYTIHKTECLDTGTYKCHASNGVGVALDKHVSLYVHCKPRMDHRFESHFHRNVEYGGMLNLTFKIIAFPAPDVSWLFRSRKSQYKAITSETANITMTVLRDFALHRFSLIMHNFEESDIGEYTATLSNTEGKEVFVFTVSGITQTATSNIAQIVGGAVAAIFIIVCIIVFAIFLMRKNKGNSCCGREGSDDLSGKQLYVNQTFSKEKGEESKDFEELDSGHYENLSDERTKHDYDTTILQKESTNKTYENVNIGENESKESTYVNVGEAKAMQQFGMKAKKNIYENANLPYQSSGGVKKTKEKMKKNSDS